VILTLSRVLFPIDIFKKEPIIVALALNKSIVTGRTHWQVRQDLLINDSLVCGHFPSAVLGDKGGASGPKVFDSIDR